MHRFHVLQRLARVRESLVQPRQLGRRRLLLASMTSMDWHALLTKIRMGGRMWLWLLRLPEGRVRRAVVGRVKSKRALIVIVAIVNTTPSHDGEMPWDPRGCKWTEGREWAQALVERRLVIVVVLPLEGIETTVQPRVEVVETES